MSYRTILCVVVLFKVHGFSCCFVIGPAHSAFYIRLSFYIRLLLPVRLFCLFCSNGMDNVFDCMFVLCIVYNMLLGWAALHKTYVKIVYTQNMYRHRVWDPNALTLTYLGSVAAFESNRAGTSGVVRAGHWCMLWLTRTISGLDYGTIININNIKTRGVIRNSQGCPGNSLAATSAP